MPLNPLPYRIVRQKLIAAGFAELSTEGSHVKFGKQTGDGFRTAIVPKHSEVAVGTIRSIVRQAGIPVDEWERL